MQLLVGLLVAQLLPSFYIVWYDLPTNSPTNYPTNNRIGWIWMCISISAVFPSAFFLCPHSNSVNQGMPVLVFVHAFGLAHFVLGLSKLI